jgi:manganese transport protein
MYKRILVALENGQADEALLSHVRQLAEAIKSELLLLHVADGWAARHFSELKLAESEEMKEDRDYLEARALELTENGLKVAVALALGNPPEQILRVAKEEGCDLIALGSHGHRLIGDIIHGSTISEVRHKSTVPVLSVSTQVD